MKRIIAGVSLLVALWAVSAPAYSQQSGGCIADRFWRHFFCSPPNGAIMPDRFDDLVCGPGQCTPDRFGDIYCSSLPGGGVALDRLKDVKCAGGCVRASSALCKPGES